MRERVRVREREREREKREGERDYETVSFLWILTLKAYFGHLKYFEFYELSRSKFVTILQRKRYQSNVNDNFIFN